MKNKRLLTSVIFVTALLSLSACGLFNDNDIAVRNSYNPVTPSSETDPDAKVVDGYEGHRVDNVKDAYCFKNVGYTNNGIIANTYKNGGAHENEFNPNGGQDYEGDDVSNNYDLYVPDDPKKDTHGNYPVILFIHGGAWVSGFKTDVNPYVHEFANKGYITATIKYTLMKRSMDDPTLSLFRNLDEIDACIKAMKHMLGELGLDTDKTRLVIGGASSGSHLAMLYSYSRGNESDIPLKFVINAVGPVDIKEDGWKCFTNETEAALDGGLSASAIAAQAAASNISELRIAGEDPAVNWNQYQTMRIANGMCGLPNSLADIEATAADESKTTVIDNAVSQSMLKNGGGEDQLSVTYWMNKGVNDFPMVAAYAGKDTIVGIAQYARLETALNTNSIDHEYVYFRDQGHTQIAEEFNASKYTEFANYIDDWCENK